MYLMVIHIPIYTEGDRCYTDVSWQRDLLLARDWLAEPFGGLAVLSPSLPLSAVEADAMQPEPIGRDDGIRVIPSFDQRDRLKRTWGAARRRWLDDVNREAAGAKLIHNSAGEVYRPLWFDAHMAGVRAGVTTVLVGPDMDPHATLTGLRGRFRCLRFDRVMRQASACADLTLLKEGLVNERYAPGANNVQVFCHTMYHDDDVLNADALERRLATVQPDRRLRAVYGGRFIPRKGLIHAIDAVAEARRQGAEVQYHLFGGGPEEAALRRRAEELGVDDLVVFEGYVEYGPAFIERLAEFDLLLFTPTEEDTPRMCYDAMAAGLPLVGSAIPFLEHRAKTDRFALLGAIRQASPIAELLVRVARDPELLKGLSRHAREAGVRHSVEHWYERRARWTRQAAGLEPADEQPHSHH